MATKTGESGHGVMDWCSRMSHAAGTLKKIWDHPRVIERRSRKSHILKKPITINLDGHLAKPSINCPFCRCFPWPVGDPFVQARSHEYAESSSHETGANIPVSLVSVLFHKLCIYVSMYVRKYLCMSIIHIYIYMYTWKICVYICVCVQMIYIYTYMINTFIYDKYIYTYIYIVYVIYIYIR